MKFLIPAILLLLSLQSIAETRLDLSPLVIQKAINDSQNVNKAEVADAFIVKVIHNSVLTTEWVRRICQKTAGAISAVYGKKSQTHCFLQDDNHLEIDKEIADLKKKINPKFELNITRRLDSKMDVALINLQQLDPNFTNKVGWQIAFDTEDNFEYDLKDRLAFSYFTINNLTMLRDSLVRKVFD